MRFGGLSDRLNTDWTVFSETRRAVELLQQFSGLFCSCLAMHHTRSCPAALLDQHGVTVRRCKNCGRWFPQTGRVSAEYCERPVASGQQTCREAGAFQQWTKKQTDDPVFKAYRKEYKKRFAWIKAGRITDEQFYAWSEQAREMKKKCDREVITLEEF